MPSGTSTSRRTRLGLGNGKAKATGLLPDISQMTADQRAALRAALDAAGDEGE